MRRRAQQTVVLSDLPYPLVGCSVSFASIQRDLLFESCISSRVTDCFLLSIRLPMTD